MSQESSALFWLILNLASDPRTAVLIALLVIAAVIDYRSYRIPNWLTLGGILFALIYRTLQERTIASGFIDSFGGMLTGFGLMLPLYLFKAMGAGDVKLMAMVGAFLGIHATPYAVLYTFIVGGVAALGFAIAKGALVRMVDNVRVVVQNMLVSASLGMKPDSNLGAGRSIGRLPYGVSIAIGTIGFVVARQLGFT